MTTVIAVKEEKVKTVEGTLDALSFDVKLAPIYDAEHRELDRWKGVYRTDQQRTLAIVGKDYELVQHRESLEPAIELLGREGWKVKASRIEAFGARAFVELHRVDKPITVIGEKVGERLMLRNSYDRTSSLIFEMGALVVKCLNGAVMPQGNLGFSGHHTGDLRKDLNAFIKKLVGIEAALGARMIETYSGLDKTVSPEIAREIVKRSLGERREDAVLQYWKTGIGRDGEMNAWNLYNGVTQFLTHDFKGNWGHRERLNNSAFDLIAGYVKTGILPTVEE
jgi:hypothetical protein